MKELTKKKSKMLESIGRINALESVQETEIHQRKGRTAKLKGYKTRLPRSDSIA
jgi:hypothetical protein